MLIQTWRKKGNSQHDLKHKLISYSFEAPKMFSSSLQNIQGGRVQPIFLKAIAMCI